jgi:hypothetical protein
LSLDDRLSGLVLAFHGCDREIGEKLLSGKEQIRPSKNKFDWLGHGAYFWENDPDRALEYARQIRDGAQKGHHVVKEPFAIGVVLDLGTCLNLLQARHLDLVRDMHDIFVQYQKGRGLPIPVNSPIGDDPDLRLRHLDCAVLEFLHLTMGQKELPAFDSVRGVFVESKPLYDNAGFNRRNHIQICVRNMECIKAYFRISGT